MPTDVLNPEPQAEPTTSPEAQNGTWIPFLASPPGRITLYASLLFLLASGICFYRLSEGTLFGDEAAFACTTDRMRTTGDLIVPRITAEPHLNATPLYNWLTLILAPAFEESPLWYRFWSAVFGVGCVLVGFALGTILFRPEVGLLAGLLLALNRGFLHDHGIRFGGMDAMLTFFIGAAVLSYAWLRLQPGRGWVGWALVGGCLGLACLSKPPVFAGVFLALICLHWLAGWRQGTLTRRVAGPALAFVVLLVVAGPWYLLLWSHLGNASLHALFVHNSVERALDPSVRDYLCCHRDLWHASTTFKLIEVALVAAGVCWVAGYRSAQWGLLLLISGGYLLALSAAGKAGNYIFYPFPLLAVVLAGLFLESGPWLVTRVWPAQGRVALLTGMGLAGVLLLIDGVSAIRPLTRPLWVHPPVGIYQRMLPDLAQGDCRFVLYDFPTADGVTASGGLYGNFEDLHYPARMPLADQVRDPGALTRLLADGKPTVVVLPQLTRPQPDLDGLQPEERIEQNPWRFYTYPVLTFHGAAGRFLPGELARLARGGQR